MNNNYLMCRYSQKLYMHTVNNLRSTWWSSSRRVSSSHCVRAHHLLTIANILGFTDDNVYINTSLTGSISMLTLPCHGAYVAVVTTDLRGLTSNRGGYLQQTQELPTATRLSPTTVYYVLNGDKSSRTNVDARRLANRVVALVDGY